MGSLIDYVTLNIYNLISTLGVILTIWFSWGARSAAAAAKSAADQTRLKLGQIEAADLVRDCVYQAQNIAEKVEAEKWDAVSSGATDVRRGLLLLRHASASVIREDHLDAIDEAVTQFKILTKLADKIRLNSYKGYRLPTVLSTVNSQVEALIPVQEHIRRKLGEVS